MRKLVPLLVLSSAVVSPWVAAARAQAPMAPPPSGRAVFGIVTDSAQVPIPRAELSLLISDAVVHTARTGDDGSFALGQVRVGPSALRVRRIGYAPVALAVQVLPDTAPAFLPIVLAANPVELGTVEVFESALEAAEHGDIHTRDFERLRVRSRFGYFIDRDEIARRGGSDVSEFLRRVPGAVIQPSGRIGNTVRLRGCRPMVWLDNVSLPGAEVDEVVRSSDVAAMAVYTSWGALPARYMDRRHGSCGAILVWTR